MKTSDILRLSEADKEVINNEFIDACKIGDLNKVIEMLNDYCNPNYKNNLAIRLASDKGHIEIVEMLLKDERVSPNYYNNEAIQLASANGHKEIVEILLKDKRVNPSDDNNYAIQFASRNGHKEIVELLLKDQRVRDKLTNEEIKKYEDRTIYFKYKTWIKKKLNRF